MDRQLEIAYEGEVHDQAVLAHRAFLRIRTAVQLHRTLEQERAPRVPDEELVSVLHESVIGFLDACAVISKMFRPAPRDSSSVEGRRALLRGRQLERSVQVDVSDAFISRAVRNAMEHIDEKMDEWLAGTPPYFKQTWVVIWSGTGMIRQSERGLRVFNAETMDLYVLGQVVNLQRMHDSLIHLDQALNSTTTDLHMRIAEPGQPGDAVSIRQATDKRSGTTALPP